LKSRSFLRPFAVLAFVAASVSCGGPTHATTAPSQIPSVSVAPTPVATYALRGRITDSQNNGIEFASVQIVNGLNANKTAITDETGQYSIADLASGDLSVRAAAAGYELQTRTVTLQADTQLTIALQIVARARTIEGLVTDGTTGGILPNVLVSAVDGARFVKSTRTDGSGRYALSDVSLDALEVAAESTSYFPVTHSIAAGTNTTVDFVLPRVPAPTPLPPPAQPPAGPPAPVPTRPLIVTFAAMSAVPLSSYTESVVTVTPTAAAWTGTTTYGHPAPFIEFRTVNAMTIGELRVTAATGPFRFQRVDLYSSITTIPWTFVGLYKGATMFTVSGEVPHTYGAFATVDNAYANVTVDTLIIRLTNGYPGLCCANPLGIDNLAIVY
jgi:hypothetical protein